MPDIRKPPIKWVGGKKWLAPRIAELYEPYRDLRFFELFAGGMGVSFHLQPRDVVGNDINLELINFFRCLRDEPIQTMKFVNTPEAYYANRQRYNELIRLTDLRFDEEKEVAELFYYLNRTGFNGLYRVNKKGEFNVPYGKYKNPQLLQDLTPWAEVVRNWQFISADFEEAIDWMNSRDFVFADPPYDDTFVGYQDGGFGWDQQVSLATQLAKHPSPVIATNNATERILELYSSLGFTIELVERRHKVNPGKESDVRPKEMLAYKHL